MPHCKYMSSVGHTGVIPMGIVVARFSNGTNNEFHSEMP